MDFKKELHKLSKKSLSGKELMDLIGRKANIISYKDLHNVKDINEILDPHGACIILYETKDHYGHWCAIMRNSEGGITFFDSYGGQPDDQLAFIPEHFRKVSNQDLPHLTALLYKSGLPIDYNDGRLQKHGSGIATCGRHVATRLALKNMNSDDYIKFMKSTEFDPDELVTLLTAQVQ